MIDRDRPGCPSCRAKLVRRLRGEPWTEPGFGPGLPVRHFESAAAAAASLSQASLLGTQAGAVRRAGMLNAGSTLLSGFGSTASPYLQRYGAV
jgi:hypothetical protein